MATLSLQHIKKEFGGVTIIDDLSLDIADREFVVFVGPSGCGKSTLIRMIAGLEEIDSGALLIDGLRMNEVGPADRGLAMVFQSYALYPHMTVSQNLSFALRLARVPRAERERKVSEAARILQLEDYLARKPGQLSGGQRQRVAIGRAIVRNPKLFLLDEPLSNLDAALRSQMRIELARLHGQLNATMIYVTHDQVEAMTMADRIVVLRAGKIEQVGTPLDLYRHPNNVFVASFIGSPAMNMLPGKITRMDDSGIAIEVIGGANVSVPVEAGAARLDDRVTLGVRPEGLLMDSTGALPGIVSLIEQLGGIALIHVGLDQGASVIAQVRGGAAIPSHQRVRLTVDKEHCHVFDATGHALRRLASQAPKETSPMRIV